MSNHLNDSLFAPLPIEEWEDSKNTLHLYVQIIGKIRLKLFPKMNPWWHVPFYVSPRGLTTRPIPYGNVQFKMEFDFTDLVREKAFWNKEADMALYMYNDMRSPPKPKTALLDFLESVYFAGAERAD